MTILLVIEATAKQYLEKIKRRIGLIVPIDNTSAFSPADFSRFRSWFYKKLVNLREDIPVLHRVYYSTPLRIEIKKGNAHTLPTGSNDTVGAEIYRSVKAHWTLEITDEVIDEKLRRLDEALVNIVKDTNDRSEMSLDDAPAETIEERKDTLEQIV